MTNPDISPGEDDFHTLIEQSMAAEMVAQRSVLFVKQGEKPIRVRLGFGKPVGNHPSCCAIYFDGFWKPKHIFGDDSLQALCESLKFMHRMIQHFQADVGFAIDDDVDDETFEAWTANPTKGRPTSSDFPNTNDSDFTYSADELFSGLTVKNKSG